MQRIIQVAPIAGVAFAKTWLAGGGRGKFARRLISADGNRGVSCLEPPVWHNLVFFLCIYFIFLGYWSHVRAPWPRVCTLVMHAHREVYEFSQICPDEFSFLVKEWEFPLIWQEVKKPRSHTRNLMMSMQLLRQSASTLLTSWKVGAAVITNAASGTVMVQSGSMTADSLLFLTMLSCDTFS